MKKIVLLSTLSFLLVAVSCKDKEAKTEEGMPVETAVEQMTEAIDTTAAMPSPVDSSAGH